MSSSQKLMFSLTKLLILKHFSEFVTSRREERMCDVCFVSEKFRQVNHCSIHVARDNRNSGSLSLRITNNYISKHIGSIVLFWHCI